MNLLPNSRGLFFCHIVNQLIQYTQEVEFYSNCWTSYPKAELLSEVVLHPMSDIGGGGIALPWLVKSIGSRVLFGYPDTVHNQRCVDNGEPSEIVSYPATG